MSASDPTSAEIHAAQTAIRDRLGEVSATPTANTIADRLKALGLLLPSALGPGGGLRVEGNVAHDAPDSGDPLGVGGIARDGSQADVSVGDRVKAAFSTRGEQFVRIGRGDTVFAFVDDGLPAGSVGVATQRALRVINQQLISNGVSLDSLFNNIDGVALASANSDVGRNSPDIVAYNHDRALFFLKITAVPSPIGTSTLTLVLSAKDADGAYHTIAATTAKNAVGNYVFMVGPGLAGGGQIADKDQIMLPRTFRVAGSHGGATGTGGFTYAVSYSMGCV